MKERSQDRFQKKILLWACGLALATACLSCSKMPFILQPPIRRAEPAPAPPQESISNAREIANASSDRAPQEPTAPPVREAEKAKPVVKPEAKEPEKPKSVMKTKALPTLPPQSPPFYHSINWNGETLSIIAAWYTGDGNNWKALAKANPQMNPNLITWGDEILIPERLLKTREGMPKAFVERFYQKPKKETPRPKPQPIRTREDEPVLFGPKKNF
jgi:nucleoid-associated protein YgaU